MNFYINLGCKIIDYLLFNIDICSEYDVYKVEKRDIGYKFYKNL